MHRSLAIVFLGAALIIAGMVTADAAAPAASAKIGFVDLERTLLETPAGKRASSKFEKSLKGKQNELDRKRKDLEKFKAEFEKQRSMLKPDVIAKREQEFNERTMELQSYFMKLQNDLATERAQLIQEVLKQAGPVIKQVAQEQGFALIVDRAAVIWASDALDITAEINKRIK